MKNQCEGIVLQSINYQDYDRIITVFSLEEGILKFLMKGSQRSSRVGHPLTCAEFTYSKGKSDLFMCREIAVRDSFLKLRESLPMLEAATSMLKLIMASQLPHKPSPKLYQLLKWCLSKLSLSKDPFFLSSSFCLKMLIHDGLLLIQDRCVVCKGCLEEFFISRGETFCSMHAPTPHVHFNEEESALLYVLVNYQSFAEIAQLELPIPLRTKIIALTRN